MRDYIRYYTRGDGYPEKDNLSDILRPWAVFSSEGKYVINNTSFKKLLTQRRSNEELRILLSCSFIHSTDSSRTCPNNYLKNSIGLISDCMKHCIYSADDSRRHHSDRNSRDNIKRSRTRHENTMLRMAEATISPLDRRAVCMLNASMCFRRPSYLKRGYAAAPYRKLE